MNRNFYRRIFQTNPEILQEMLYLYQNNNKWNINRLARKYDCDRTSILYQLKKYGIYKIGKKELRKKEGKPRIIILPIKKIKIEKIKPYIIKPYIDERGEPVNPGKSYEEYLKEYLKKYLKKNKKHPTYGHFFVE